MAGTARHASIFRAIASLAGLVSDVVPFPEWIRARSVVKLLDQFPARLAYAENRKLVFFSVALEYLRADWGFVHAVED